MFTGLIEEVGRVGIIRPTGRATQGVRVMTPTEGAKVVSIAPVREGDDLEDE